MAPSVAALQRLSASIEVSASSRSNSRASVYEDNSSSNNHPRDLSEKSSSEIIRPVNNEHDLSIANSSHIIAESSAATSNNADDDAGRAQYLTANCVVFTFYSGDLTSAIDDHFSRALKSTAIVADHHTAAEGASPPVSTELKSESATTKHQSGTYQNTADY
jgi:hypothetical protein